MVPIPPWPVVQSLLLTVVLPGFGVGAGVLAGVCALTASTTTTTTARLLGGAVAVAGGLVAGNLASGLMPWWSVETGWPSLFPATLAVIAGGLLARRVGGRGPGRSGWESAVCYLVLVATTWWLTPPGPLVPRLGWFALLLAGSTLNLEALRRPDRWGLEPFTLPALVVPWGGAAGIVLIHAHSARFFDLAVLLTATLAGAGLAASRWKLDLSPIALAPALFFPALLLNGAANTFSEVPGAGFGLAAIAPAALGCLLLPPLRGWTGRRRAVAALIAVLVPCAVAVALAMHAESLDFGE